MFIGRERELTSLNKLYQSKKFEFARTDSERNAIRREIFPEIYLYH